MEHKKHLDKDPVAYTCPMHPEIVRGEPGDYPICGMALEPRDTAAEEENPELNDMTRHFWISAVFAVPLFILAMLHDLAPQVMTPFISTWPLPWIEQFGIEHSTIQIERTVTNQPCQHIYSG